MKTKTFLLGAIALLALTINLSAAYESYFRADTISGDSLRAAWSEHTAVRAFSHEVTANRDTATGLPTGKRQHAPFKILKQISGNSPQFMQKLVANETIETAELKLLTVTNAGQEIVFYTYRFTGVKILSIRNWVSNDQINMPELEEITFLYDTIEWRAEVAKTSATDSLRR